MKKIKDSTDEYYVFLFNKIITIAPIVGLCAILTFTFARIAGHFSTTKIEYLVAFDVTCILYFAVAGIMKKIGVTTDGEINPVKFNRMHIVFCFVVILQWNLITYIFPARALWGYAPMFVMLNAFTFKRRVVAAAIIGISASIAVSWVVLGDKLLPAFDGMYEENLILRIVALVISFSVIYALTYFAERFTLLAKKNAVELREQNDHLEKMGREILDFTADIIEQRDATSGTHVKRLRSYTRTLAEEIAKLYPEYGLDSEKIEIISRASALHDVGKICISDSILMKPGKLTPEEFEIMKTHSNLGAQIIDKLPESMGEEYKRYCREICRYHHEKFDGGGYPCGLVGDEIPISAQIVSAVDCYDALTTDRPYKKALPGDVAVNMILGGQCGVFSDKIKACIENCRDRFAVI